MTYDELRIFILEEIDWYGDQPYVASLIKYLKSTLAVVQLHRPKDFARDTDWPWVGCMECEEQYPCDTIQDIEKELG
jgi:hypothetical protein